MPRKSIILNIALLYGSPVGSYHILFYLEIDFSTLRTGRRLAFILSLWWSYTRGPHKLLFWVSVCMRLMMGVYDNSTNI